MDTMKSLVLAALLLVVGCGDGAVTQTDAGSDVGADTGPEVGPCGVAAGQALRVHFTRTMGTCAAAVDLDVVIPASGDFCSAVGQVRSDVFGPGTNDIACYGAPSACHFSAAVAATDCQGSYSISF